jgi:hypothetical protein
MNLPDQQFIIALSHLICARQRGSHLIAVNHQQQKARGDDNILTK